MGTRYQPIGNRVIPPTRTKFPFWELHFLAVHLLSCCKVSTKRNLHIFFGEQQAMWPTVHYEWEMLREGAASNFCRLEGSVIPYMLLLSQSEIDHFNVTNSSREFWNGFADSIRLNRRNAGSIYCYLHSGRAMIGARFCYYLLCTYSERGADRSIR